MAGRGRGFILPAWKTQGLAATTESSSQVGVNPPAANSTVNANTGSTSMEQVQSVPQQNIQPPSGMPPPGMGFPPGMPPPSIIMQQQQPPSQAQQPVQPPPMAPVTPPVQRGPWTEHKAPDGKLYYHNVMTGLTTYEKPDVFKSEIERQLPQPLWKEYIKDGKSYFFNSETNESVWEEPMAFTQYKARLEAMCTGEAPTKDQASMALFNAAKKALEECVVDSDGTGAIKREKEKQAMLERNVSENAQRVKAASELELKTVSGDLKSGSENALEYKSPEEAAAAFKQMLSDRKVPANASWVEALGYGIANDKRFRALKSLKKRKKALEEYANWKKDKEEQELRQAEEKAEAAFKEMLLAFSSNDQTEGSEKPKLNGRTRLGEAIAVLENEEVYKAVKDSRTREKLIRNHLDTLFEKEKEERRIRDRHLKKQATAALDELYQAGKISIDTAFGSTLKQVLIETKDERILALEDSALPDLWKNFVDDIKEKLRREKVEAEQKKREELKEARDSFYRWLKKGLREGNLSLDKPFATEIKSDKHGRKEVNEEDTLLGDIKDEELYKKLVALDEKAPKEEYDYIIKKLDVEVEDCRQIIKKMLKKAKISLTVASKFDDIRSELAEFFKQNVDEAKGIRKSIASLADSKRRSKSREKDHKEENGKSDIMKTLIDAHTAAIVKAGFAECVRDAKKKLKKKKKNFEDLLFDVFYKSDHVGMPWELAKVKISKEDEFLALGDEEIRIEVFKEYMKKLKAKKEKKKLAAAGAGKGADAGMSDEEEDGEIKSEDEVDDAKRKRESNSGDTSSSKKVKTV